MLHSVYFSKRIHCAVLFIFYSFIVTAQDITVRLYSAKDGLPSTYIYSICQDKYGYLWIGTPDGISRFDGKNFTNYGLEDGLPDTRITNGFMDSHYRYWAATPKGAVEFKGNKFTSYPLSDSQNITWVFQILETKKGEILSLTSNGIYKFDNDKWWKINFYAGYKNHPCRNIIETDEGMYINYGDLVILKKNGISKIIGPFKSPGYYYNNLLMCESKVFLSNADGMFTIAHEQLIRLKGELGSLKGNNLYYRDSKKRFWIGNEEEGIRLLEPGDSSHFKKIYNPGINIIPQQLIEDKQGNIWIATGMGLLRISEMGFRILKLPELTSQNTIFNIFQPPSGPLLINNGSFTLQALMNDSFIKKQLQIKNKAVLPDNELIIDHFAFDDKNCYWYCLRGLTLVMQQGNSLYEQNDQRGNPGGHVFDVMFDAFRKKIIIAAETQKYPCIYNDSDHDIFSLVNNNIKVNSDIRLLHQCVNGTILFSTNEGFIYSIDTNKVCRLQLHEFNTNAEIAKFYNDPFGNVWIIYHGRGLRCYAWHRDSLAFKYELTRANGLPADNASSLCFDNRNNLWVCTNSNVAVFSKEINEENDNSYRLVTFFETADLQIGDAYPNRLVKDLAGNIWLFSGRHLICFYPDKINYVPGVPSVMIEDVRLNLRQTNWANYADSLSGIFQLPYHLKLAHYNNSLGIYYKGIYTSGTENIKYSYVLEGLNNTWSVPSANDFVSYVKLPPGKYVFKVKAQLPNAKWSKPAEFAFVIGNAFWQASWFVVLAAIIIITGIYLLFRYRLQEKTRLLEMRNSISQDLHDELGASISGINLLSQMAAEKLQGNHLEEASAYLYKVKNYTQDVIEKLGDMVWIFNPRNDGIEKLLQRIQNFAVSIASSRNIKMHFENAKENEIINLTIRERKAIYLVSKEALNNAFKYSECSNIHYSLNAKGAKWKLVIKDDGKGFIPEENNTGNGLKNMQARADEINAVFNIQSGREAGTIITLSS